VSDGTAVGTFLLRDINADPNAAGPGTMFALNSLALFPVDDGIHGMELWVTDGTSNGTHLVKDINPRQRVEQPSRPYRRLRRAERHRLFFCR